MPSWSEWKTRRKSTVFLQELSRGAVTSYGSVIAIAIGRRPGSYKRASARCRASSTWRTSAFYIVPIGPGDWVCYSKSVAQLPRDDRRQSAGSPRDSAGHPRPFPASAPRPQRPDTTSHQLADSDQTSCPHCVGLTGYALYTYTYGLLGLSGRLEIEGGFGWGASPRGESRKL